MAYENICFARRKEDVASAKQICDVVMFVLKEKKLINVISNLLL